MNIKTDILIIGGGIAGCIAAISLADSYQVVLIDKLSEPNERIGESLAPAAQRILKHLDLLEGMEGTCISNEQLYLKNIGMQSYWGSEKVHIVDHLRNPDGFGRNLNRKAFEVYLRETALKRGVTCIWPAKLTHSNYDDFHWHIVAKSENNNGMKKVYNITSNFVIEATGRQSHFARNIGVKRQHYDKLITCWATMPNYQENKMSTISSSENGWWYSAIVPNNKRVLAFQTDSDLIDKNALKDLDSFLLLSQGNREINTILEKNRDGIKFHGTVAANSTQLKQVSGNKWVALGDAAISFDPLSSQGMFHAMASSMQLKALILKSEIIDTSDSSNMKLFEMTYSHQINQIWEHYLKHKTIFYREEMRWKESPFWKRRH